MEFNCPDCGKRLRAPDHLHNPLVRCRTCGATFRPREEQGALDSDTVTRPIGRAPALQPSELPRSTPESFRRPEPLPSAKSLTAKGLGVAVMVLLIVLAKSPKLLKMILPEKPRQPPVPVQIEREQLQMLRDLQNRPRRPPWPDQREELRRLVPNDDPFANPPPLAPAPQVIEPQ